MSESIVILEQFTILFKLFYAKGKWSQGVCSAIQCHWTGSWSWFWPCREGAEGSSPQYISKSVTYQQVLCV